MVFYPGFHVPFFHWITQTGGTIDAIILFCLAITLVTSGVLAFIMIRYKGKRPVDIAVVMREIAIILVLARVFIAVAWGNSPSLLSLIIYIYLGISVGALLFLTIRSQWFPPLVQSFENQQDQIDQQGRQITRLKEKLHGHEKV